VFVQLPLQNRYSITLDDDPMVYRLIESMTDIKSLPFSVRGKLSSSLSQYRPVVVFVDVHLGSESGLQAIPFLKSRWPFAPVIVMTSDPASDAVAEALDCGADRLYRKPLNKTELVSRLQTRLTRPGPTPSPIHLAHRRLCLDTGAPHFQYRGKEESLSNSAVGDPSFPP
jgi:DNA-binding response OmpR family regulator